MQPMFKFSLFGKFTLLALLGIVAFSLLWVNTGSYISMPAAYLTKWILEDFARGWVNFVSIENGLLVLNSSIEIMNAQTGWRRGEVMIEESFARYAYCFSILFSLILAISRKNVFTRFLIGYIALIPLQAFSLTFYSLMQLCVAVSMDLSLLKINAFAFNVLIYFYQFGTLIMPVLAPVIIWLYIDKDLIKQLMLNEHSPATS
jgi:hypothetical protein